MNTWRLVRTCPYRSFLLAPLEERTPVRNVRPGHRHGEASSTWPVLSEVLNLVGLCFHHHKMGLSFPTPVITERMKIMYVKCQWCLSQKQTQAKDIRGLEEAPRLLPCDLFFHSLWGHCPCFSTPTTLTPPFPARPLPLSPGGHLWWELL